MLGRDLRRARLTALPRFQAEGRLDYDQPSTEA
jgi:hypothetical protein